MRITSNKRVIEISHPDKIWFPESGYTKAAIVQYYHDIAPHMVPFMQHRPLTMLRYPDGITGESFYHKDMPAYFPDWIDSVSVAKKEGGKTRYVVCNNAETLVYIANQGCITPHLWLSTVQALRKPDKLIFDLDPSTNYDFALVKQVAKKLYALLDSMRIPAYLMTTGSRGLHVVIPLAPYVPEDFSVIRGYARTIAQEIVNQMPNKVTLEARKEKRGKRLLIDVMRNGFGQTAVAPYAVRARPHAPVATPIEWDELDNSHLRSDLYTIKTIFKRLKSVGNIWKNTGLVAK